MNNQIGNNIRRHRELKGYSQENMAHLLDISQGAYAKIENNSTKITVARLFEIARHLEVDVIQLMGLGRQTIFNMNNNQSANANSFEHVENVYQENKEIFQKLVSNLEKEIEHLKEEIVFLRNALEKKS